MSQQAPLHATPDSPVPGRAKAEWVTGVGGVKLRAALFTPEGTPRGSVVINTGRTEAIEKYYETIGELLGRGFVVLIHDWRGQGLSDRLLPGRPLHGHVVAFADFLADLRILLDRYVADLPQPRIVLGHSMGGCLTMLALTQGEPRFAACLLTSPMFALITKPYWPPVARAVAWFKAHFGAAEEQRSDPADDPLWQHFETNVFTHDRGRYERYSGMLAAHPELALGAPTWGWIDGAFGACARAQATAAASIPVVIFSAGGDQIVDIAGHRTVAARLGIEPVAIAGVHHEILIETNDVRTQFWREFDALAARL